MAALLENPYSDCKGMTLAATSSNKRSSFMIDAASICPDCGNDMQNYKELTIRNIKKKIYLANCRMQLCWSYVFLVLVVIHKLCPPNKKFFRGATKCMTMWCPINRNGTDSEISNSRLVCTPPAAPMVVKIQRFCWLQGRAYRESGVDFPYPSP